MNKSHQLEPIRLQVPLYMGVIKEITKLVPRVLLRYISTWEFLRTLEKCEKHSASAPARASPHFSSLKNSQVFIELNNALGALFISLTANWIFCTLTVLNFPKGRHFYNLV